MNRTRSLFASLPVALWLTGCSGGSAPMSAPAPVEQSFGSLTTRIVGAAQSSVTSSAAYGANVSGIAGALVDRLTLNALGPGTLSDTRIAFVSDRDGNNEIYSMNADGSNQIRLTNNGAGDSEPSWSPDGTKIAFQSSRDGNIEIYVMNADGSSPTRLSNNAASDFSPSWSPDGTKIVFVSDRTGFGDIYVMNADGSAQTRLTTATDSDAFPSWSPDGTKIAFNSSRDGNSEIYAMDPNGSNQTRLTNNVAVDNRPSWSPDSTKIAFSSNRDGNFEVYAMYADGTGQTNLSNSPSNDDGASWSPDGTKIAFSSSRDGNSEIYAMRSFGADQTNLTRLSGSSEYLSSWSRYLPRTPRTLIGAGGTLGTAAAGFLFGQKGKAITSVVAFDTSTAGSRAASRVISQSAPFNDQGTNLLFAITTSAGLASVTFAPINEAGVPGTAVSPTIPAGSTNALVSFDSADGSVTSVVPYAANRSASLKPVRSGDNLTYSGSFTAVFDATGKNLAPGGAKSVTLDEKTGKLLRFE